MSLIILKIIAILFAFNYLCVCPEKIFLTCSSACCLASCDAESCPAVI